MYLYNITKNIFMQQTMSTDSVKLFGEDIKKERPEML